MLESIYNIDYTPLPPTTLTRYYYSTTSYRE